MKDKDLSIRGKVTKFFKVAVPVAGAVVLAACTPTSVDAPNNTDKGAPLPQEKPLVVPPPKQEAPAIPEVAKLPEVTLLNIDDFNDLITAKEWKNANPSEFTGIGAEATKFVFVPNNAEKTVNGYMKRDGKWFDLQGLPMTETQTVWALSNSVDNSTDPSGLPTPVGGIAPPEIVLDYDLNVKSKVTTNGIEYESVIVNVHSADGKIAPYTVPVDYRNFYNNASYKPTAEAPAPVEVNMTFEDWKKFFDQKTNKFRGGNLKIIFEPIISSFVFTQKEDAQKLAGLDPLLPYDILKSNGVIMCTASQNDALNALNQGGVVLVSRDARASSICVAGLLASNTYYLEGNRNSNGDPLITVQFGTQPELSKSKASAIEIDLKDLSNEYLILTETGTDGRISTPIIQVPPSIMSLKNDPFDQVFAPDVSNDGKYWINALIKTGYNKLDIWNAQPSKFPG